MNALAQRIAEALAVAYRELLRDGMPKDIAQAAQLIFITQVAASLGLGEEFIFLVLKLSNANPNHT